MGRRFTSVAALAATVGAVFALAPSSVERVVPDVPVVQASSKAGVLAIDLVDGATDADLASVGLELGVEPRWTSEHSKDEALAQVWVEDLGAAVALLEDDPRVEVVEPVVHLHTLGFPDDPMYDKQWHMREMGAPVGWDETPRGRGIVVAVIDTGVTQVEDLKGTTVLEGASMVPGESGASDGNGHGTHVAGTIAQTTNNGVGVTGVAPEAAILPVKVLSKWGSGMSTWIAAGIDYAVDEGADVINLSLGGGYSSIIHNAIKKAEKKGVIVVAAAGNSGKEGVSWPGALDETIGVSAVGPGGKLAPYSSWGSGVDMAGPGGDKTRSGGGVFQNTVDGKGGEVYAEYQGTSMATPHVAGAAAVLLSTGASPEAVSRLLLETAAGDGWDNKLGHGRLDLAAAVNHVDDQHGATLFALGLVFALLVGHLAAVGARFRVFSGAVAGVLAGGVWFLEVLPVPSTLPLDMLGTSFLYWPALVAWPDAVHFPLWLSAAIPGAVAFTLGAFRGTRGLALGLTCGVGAHLLHGAATGTLDPAWLPGSLGVAWLVANGLFCLLLSVGLAGAEKLDADKR